MAVEGADIVNVCNNTSTGKETVLLLRGRMDESRSMHVNSIGSTMPSMREIDIDTFEKADVHCD